MGLRDDQAYLSQTKATPLCAAFLDGRHTRQIALKAGTELLDCFCRWAHPFICHVYTKSSGKAQLPFNPYHKSWQHLSATPIGLRIFSHYKPSLAKQVSRGMEGGSTKVNQTTGLSSCPPSISSCQDHLCKIQAFYKSTTSVRYRELPSQIVNKFERLPAETRIQPSWWKTACQSSKSVKCLALKKKWELFSNHLAKERVYNMVKWKAKQPKVYS
jgi:hypothetical protein